MKKGILTPDAQQRALAAMKRFKKVIDEYAVDHVRAIATSAMRNARNAPEVIQQIKDETAIDISVISGEEEAELIYRGVSGGMKLQKGNHLIMDIGGGSVEFIICDSERSLWKQSFEIGAQRLLDSFHCHDPIFPTEVVKLKSYLVKKLQPLFKAATLHQPSKLIGSSGTFETLLEIYRLKNNAATQLNATAHSLPLDQFKAIYYNMLLKSREECLKIPGLVEMRVDMIIVACTLIHLILEIFNISHIEVSVYSLKTGLFFNVVEALQQENWA